MTRRVRRQVHRELTFRFVIQADTEAELEEAAGIVADEVDAVPENAIDIISHPGNYDAQIKHRHANTSVDVYWS